MFKDIIANDIKNVFLNTEEYAAQVKINGELIDVVVDNEHLNYQHSQDELDGLVGDIYYFVSKQEWLAKFGKLPEANDAQQFNKKPCTVIKVGDTNGMLNITLSYRG